jgi:hypothetical protein
MNYFKWSDEIEKGMDGYRGHFVSICFDKKDGTERVLNGVLCRARDQFLVNEGTTEEPEFKQFNVNKIKWVRLRGITHKPKEQSK